METVHCCLSCGGDITQDQEEEAVPSRYQGVAPRYRHARQEDCQAALSAFTAARSHLPSGGRKSGKVGNLRTLEQIERNAP